MPLPRVGVIGAGQFSRNHHLPSLRDYEHCELVAVCDQDLSRAQRVAAEFDVPLAFGDVADMLDADHVDALVIATWHTTHYALTKAALQAGRSVLLEKPMTLRSAEAWELAELAESAGVHLLIGYTFQYTSVASQVRSALKDGAVGDLVQLVGSFPSRMVDLLSGQARPGTDTGDGWRPPYSDPDRSGGGQGQTQLTHLAGMALWATGDRVTEAFAYLANASLPLDLADVVAFRTARGMLGSLASVGTAERQEAAGQFLHYYGTRGHLAHDLLTGEATVVRYDGSTTRWVLRPGEDPYPTRRPARVLVDLVAGRTRQNPAPAEAGARAVELLEAVYASAATSAVATVRATAR